MVYQIHFISHGGHRFGTTLIESADDARAKEKAQGMHVPAIGYGYELWQDDRLVSAYPKKLAVSGKERATPRSDR